MIDPKHTKEVLKKFGDSIVKKARQNIDKFKIIKTGKLKRSVDYELDGPGEGGGFSFSILMEKYGIYQDQGTWAKLGALNGTSLRSRARPKKLKDIRHTNGIHTRNRGIKPTYFLTSAMEKAYANLDTDVVDAYALDEEEFLVQHVLSNFKQQIEVKLEINK